MQKITELNNRKCGTAEDKRTIQNISHMKDSTQKTAEAEFKSQNNQVLTDILQELINTIHISPHCSAEL